MCKGILIYIIFHVDTGRVSRISGVHGIRYFEDRDTTHTSSRRLLRRQLQYRVWSWYGRGMVVHTTISHDMFSFYEVLAVPRCVQRFHKNVIKYCELCGN